jgi:CHAT domain-containing protein/Tfp pilus assembly protein PilF
VILENARWIKENVPYLAGIRIGFDDHELAVFFRLILCVSTLLILLLSPIEDTRPGGAESAYSHALKLFQLGRLVDCQQESKQGYGQFRISNPEWAAKFQLLEAEAMVWRGFYDDALRLLGDFVSDTNHPEETIRELAIEGAIFTRQQQFAIAEQKLSRAAILCNSATYAACGDVLRARGVFAVVQEKHTEAKRLFLETLAFARTHHDQLLEANAVLNLGWNELHVYHYDEAMDWSRAADQIAADLNAENIVQVSLGNLGWAYFQLGDDERALEQFLEAKKSATRLGNPHLQLVWITTAGYVYRNTGDLNRAARSYQQALSLARQIDSKKDITNTLEDLADISVETGKLDEASAYLDQVASSGVQSGNLLKAYVMLTRGKLAAARRQDQQADKLFRIVQNDSANPTTTRLEAGRELAQLFELQGKKREAEQSYKATLAIFESARAQLKHEDSRLPFAANATGIYDGYIHLLVEQGRSEEALAAADQSRARTLAQGLGVEESKAARLAALHPRQIAQSSGATLLFYWLGAQHSYLWAITPSRITLIPLPAQKELSARIERYRRALLDGEDPQRSGNEDGRALYQTLVAPAAKQLRPGATVMILADGALSQLNFETLLAPGPGSNSGQGAHYWINDQALLSAPSLELLASARPAQGGGRKLLLVGNPVTPSPDYPSLPHFSAEMSQVARHFSARSQAAFAGEQATPAAYLASHPAQYSYIHFVSHATASRTDPLDSAIILSGSTPSGSPAGENSFKLYAREIIEHPIDARLVTISACNGSGTRAYAGEGLVGLSWAFLRAGAHNVIGALWEVSDDSTPRLMDALYQGLQQGQAPSAALRNAKLNLLHSRSRFSAPFYWAPFQIYTRR